MTIKIAPFSGMLHMYQTVDVLLDVRKSDETYPPPIDADNTVGDFLQWLMSEETVGRWVALIDDDVVGHISLTKAHDYLTRFLDGAEYEGLTDNGFCEVSKFFVSPKAQGRGIGEKLFTHALEQSWLMGAQPALAVISTSYAARRFYAHKGMLELGSFHGTHGENFVFVDERSSHEAIVAPAASALHSPNFTSGL